MSNAEKIEKIISKLFKVKYMTIGKITKNKTFK